MRTTPQRLVHLTGLKEISDVLNQIPEDLRTKVALAGVKAGAKPMVEATKRFARRSVRTGALYMAIGSIEKEYKSSATAVAIVGVRKGYYKNRKALGKGDDRRGSESPSHYAHLVEHGHHIVTEGTLRPQYSLKKVGIGKFSHKGNELKRWKRDKIIKAATGRKIGFVAPRPFMRPGFHASKAAVAREMHKAVMRGVQASVRRLVKQGQHKR